MIRWNAKKSDVLLVQAIANRAVATAKRLRINYDRTDSEMDLLAVHLNGCRLDLKKLLQTDDFNFNHDVFGIRRHLDRETGQLKDCFLPRSAAPEQKKHARRVNAGR